MFDLSDYKPNYNKTVIFRCNAQGFGGIGDRLIGLCSSFVLSLILNFDFKVLWTYPIDLTQLFDEKNIKWHLNSYDVNNNDIQLNFLDHNLDKQTKNMLENNPNLINIFNNNVVIISNKPFYLYLLNNKYLHNRLKKLNIIYTDDIISNCMSILFALKSHTQIKYNKLLTLFSKYYTVGVQIRSFIGEFFDELDVSKLTPYYKFIEDYYNIYGNTLLVFLCSDSQIIIEHIINKYPHIKFLLTDHSIIHLERSVDYNQDLNNNLKLILELYSLGRTRQLIITHSSNFGRLSSLISNKIPYINYQSNYELTTFKNILTKDKD